MIECESVDFEVLNGDSPVEIARRVCSVVDGNRDIYQKNGHCWFFGEDMQWALLRVTSTKYSLRYNDGYVGGQIEALETVLRWLLNERV